jgi:4'-phosphopantetheinyl transferase
MHPIQEFSTIANEWPILRSDEVHVWRADSLRAESQMALLQNWISEEEKQRAERFRFPEHRSMYIASHGILRSILSSYVNLPPDQLQFSSNAYGKPELSDQNKKELHFSLSHTDRCAVYSVTLRRQIGIDIEQIRFDFDCLELAKRFFAPGEIEALSSLPADQQPDAFFRCWTRKEAYVKATGQGLSLSLRDFEVSLDRKEQTPIRTHQQSENWFAFSFSPFSKTIAALAVEGTPRLQFWSF